MSTPDDLPELHQGMRGAAVAGYALIILGVGVFFGWTAWAQIDGGVVAPGFLSVERKRQVVQHLEGGIIASLKVREGQKVEAQDLLAQMDQTAPQAAFEANQGQYLAALALEARLVAERDGSDTITFPADLLKYAAHPVALDAMADQQRQFSARFVSIKGQIDILVARIRQLKDEVDGLKQERASLNKQISFVNEELNDVRYLTGKGLVGKPRLSSLEREGARLEGAIGRNSADQAKAESSMGEANLQIGQIRQKFLEEVGAQLLDVRQKIAELKEKIAVARNVLGRVEIRAPYAGIVQNINDHFYTAGAVVRPGDTILEIVPERDALEVEARVPVNEIDRVSPLYAVEVKFPAFHGHRTPVMLGQLKSVSADRLMDETTKQPYYRALVSVSDISVPGEYRARLIAGMPAEVVFVTGSRSVLSYLTKPLADALGRSFREP